MSKHLSILILAAGASTRMKKTKQLLPWGEHTLIEHVLANAISSDAKNIYVLLGAHSEAIRNRIQSQPVNIVENKDWTSGLGKSIAIGVRSILQQENPEGILIMLCDQPLIDSPYINRMLRKLSESGDEIKIIGTQYGSKIGVPAIFSPALYHELVHLETDRGAAQLIADNIQNTVSIDPAGKEKDMDTWQDYIGLRP